MKKRILSLFTFFSLLSFQATSQIPLRCDGSMFVVTNQNPRLYRIAFDREADTVKMAPLTKPVGFQVTAMGYSKRDNFIYGAAYINQEYQLCKIDSTGQGFLLKHIPLDTTEFQGIYGADVTPDGSSLILFVNPRGSISNPNMCIIVDLTSFNYNLQNVIISTLAGAPQILVGDIVYHPISELLFSHDYQQVYNSMPNPYGGKTVIIDPFMGIIDNQVFFNNPQYGATTSYCMLSTPFGEIFGIGNVPPNFGNWTELDAATGISTKITMGDFYNINPDAYHLPDGCSCPYTLALEKTVDRDSVYGCTEVVFTYHISNLTENNQDQVVFRDSFPPGFEITEIIYNPYTGIISGINSNVFEITGMTLNYGIDSIQIKVLVPDGAEGTHFTQAYLVNVDLSSTNQTANAIRSDFPPTAERWDATPLTVIPLEIELASATFELCPDSTLLIAPFYDATGLIIEWSDGSTGPVFLVHEAGNYNVTVSGGCDKDSANFSVVVSPLSVFLGDDVEGQFGDVIELRPEITFLSPLQSYYWEINAPSTLLCDSCLQTDLFLMGNTTVSFTVENEIGCQANDKMVVTAIRQLFSPNAFSPNEDGINDWFYLQSKNDLAIKSFKVFDRWGGLVFEKSAIYTNDEQNGWNGKAGTKPLHNGIYAWFAEVVFPDGVSVIYKGEISLVK